MALPQAPDALDQEQRRLAATLRGGAVGPQPCRGARIGCMNQPGAAEMNVLAQFQPSDGGDVWKYLPQRPQ